MPPQQSPAIGQTTRRSRLRLVILLIAVLVLGGVAAYYVLSRGTTLQEAMYDWGEGTYLIQGESGPSYIFSDGEFTETERGLDPEHRFEAPGWPLVIIQQTEDGLDACSEEGCRELMSFGAPVEKSVAYTVSGDILMLIHPLAGNVQGFRLLPGNPARIEPAFLVESGEGLMGATGLVAASPENVRYLSVGESEAGVTVCAHVLASDRTVFQKEACLTQAANVKNPVITKLP